MTPFKVGLITALLIGGVLALNCVIRPAQDRDKDVGSGESIAPDSTKRDAVPIASPPPIPARGSVGESAPAAKPKASAASDWPGQDLERIKEYETMPLADLASAIRNMRRLGHAAWPASEDAARVFFRRWSPEGKPIHEVIQMLGPGTMREKKGVLWYTFENGSFGVRWILHTKDAKVSKVEVEIIDE